ncbi:hypothetical protein [Roseixanthobacter glucoisosaccharinicivorans]|uniref:hypothetical protein n=1 Tax=Roseixanthobacter glucoisosaccharinicivorans TaxID=3119923 RepID=UPI003726A827
MANWNRKLALPISVAGSDGDETLVTLHDAALFIIRQFEGVRSQAVRRTVESLVKAAELDSAAASEEASRQLEMFLASLMRE